MTAHASPGLERREGQGSHAHRALLNWDVKTAQRPGCHRVVTDPSNTLRLSEMLRKSPDPSRQYDTERTVAGAGDPVGWEPLTESRC